MRYEDVKDYIQLQDMIQARCEEVCGLLTPLNDSYRYLTDFEINLDTDEIWGEGDEYLGYGESDLHSAKFPSNFLWKDDEEIKQYVEDELNKRREVEESKRLEIQKLLKEVQERKDREEYERLKKKFGGA
jgi:hypothetical protein